MKKLLVLGGTRISCEIINKAKEMGLYVAVTDYNNPEDSPGKQIADESYMVSCTDIDNVVKLIKDHKFDGVITGFSDQLLPYYAEICNKAGLPAYGTKEQFNIFTNKDKYKPLLRKFGLPVGETYDVDPENINEKMSNVRFPLFIKPADGSGARGTSVCYKADDFIECYKKALDFSKSGKVIVEQYLEGKEATVFWVFVDGEYYLCGIGNRHVKKNQEGSIPLPVGYTFPAMVTYNYIATAVKKTQAMFRETGIKNGMMFMQCKVQNNECWIYDIGFRLTGSLEYKLFNKACGFDPLEMMINYAVTGKMWNKNTPVPVDPFFKGCYPFNVSCLAKPGKIAEIRGLDQVKKIPGVLDAVVAHSSGEEITQSMKGLLSQITVRILGYTIKKEDLIPTMKEIEDTIEIVSDLGENLRLSGIEDSDIEDVI